MRANRHLLILCIIIVLLYTANSQSCHDKETCSNHGVCEASDTCKCDSGYATLDPEFGIYCDYQRKLQFKAFFLHFFLGAFGAGRFYTENYIKGSFQLALTVVGVCFGFACWHRGVSITRNMDEEVQWDAYETFSAKEDAWMRKLGGMVSVVCSAIIITLWWIIDCVLFGLNDIHDGNDIPLQPW
eukprot:324378_1